MSKRKRLDRTKKILDQPKKLFKIVRMAFQQKDSKWDLMKKTPWGVRKKNVA